MEGTFADVSHQNEVFKSGRPPPFEYGSAEASAELKVSKRSRPLHAFDGHVENNVRTEGAPARHATAHRQSDGPRHPQGEGVEARLTTAYWQRAGSSPSFGLVEVVPEPKTSKRTRALHISNRLIEL